MLGRLLHLGSGGTSAVPSQTATKMSRPVSSLESVQEDIHTRNLLFPDAQALYQHRNDQVFPLSSTPTTPGSSTANAFDFSGDVDLDVRDVRVIIMQDALGPSNASLLFDSHPAPPTSPIERVPGSQDLRRVPTSPRKSSLGNIARPLVIQPDSPQPTPRQGAFDRRASLQGRSQTHGETDTQRAAREYREELATFSSCIFGNSELMSYKGTSTKVHVVPGETRPTDIPASVIGDGRSSIGRSSGRSSRLSQSYSSQAISPTTPSTFPNTHSRQSEKKKVLITRLFPVNLIVDDAEAETSPPGRYSDENVGFPFPATGDEPAPKKKKSQPKQRRTPMYAVVLVIQLPPPPPTSTRLPATQPKSSHRESSSYNDQEFFPSSFSSARPSGWTMVGSSNYGDATESTYSIDMEDRIDSLTQHWDIIMRTLTHLQSVVETILGTMLKQVDLASPGPFANSTSFNSSVRAPSLSERHGGELPRVKPPKSTTKLVSLLPNCLADDKEVWGQVDAARHRIVMGLSAARVVTGQGRWGIWRDEARWTSRWAGSVERGQFFYNLLTGFLATHTDWLQALCPPSYRRRLYQQQRSRNEEDLSLPARTVVVSEDKMAARRLIFLLSAFLPENQNMPTTRAHRPSTSTSVGTYSNSPPTFVIPVLREESLRRKINRRTGLRRASHSRTASHSQSVRASAVPSQLAHLTMDRNHERRVSDAAPIRPSNLPISGNDLVSRKSSAATTTTVLPETTIPHFSTVQRVDSHRRPRPSSSGSVAADDLKRSLKRGESSGYLSNTSTDSRSQSSRWGSVISGLWSTRRRDSTTMSSYSQADPKSPTKSGFNRTDKLSQMVEEGVDAEDMNVSTTKKTRPSMNTRGTGTPQDFESRTREPSIRPERTPDPTGAFESPVKTSINADDGVIDVDIPFPDYMTSFESAISSPSSSGYLSTPGIPNGLDSFEQASRLCVDGDSPLNAAGWLNRFHPDFAVQAIPPQEDLLEQVKASLKAEPTPSPLNPLNGDLSERWVDVSCAMIADTTTNLITRIRYRRLVKPKSPTTDRPSSGQAGPSSSHGGTVLTPSILPYETQLDEDWIEDQIIQPDEALTEAVEKIISLTQDTSKDHSLASSQTHSEVRMSTEAVEPVSVTAPEPPVLPQTPLEVPRMQCKSVVLSALEDNIREAIDLRERGEQGTNGHSRSHRAQQNLLEEAINCWLDNLDATDS